MLESRQKTRSAFKVLALLALIVASFVFHTWLRTSTLSRGFSLGQLRNQIRLQESKLRALSAERGRLFSPSELDAEAKRLKLDGIVLKPALQSQVLHLGKRPTGSQ